MQENTIEYIITDETELDAIDFSILAWDRIFFYGDLWSGKSTFIRHLLRRLSKNPSLVVRSPTYMYYQKYELNAWSPIYHCDLYRVEDYSTWTSFGGVEILEERESIFLIEWPEVLWDTVIPTKIVSIEIMETGERRITIVTSLPYQG